MEKNRKWQIFLILSVLCLTIYNVLPTLFYYLQPLSQPIGQKESFAIQKQIETRVNSLEQESKEWVSSFCDLLGIKPAQVKSNTPAEIVVTFTKKEEADLLRKFLPRAGSLIPFSPLQLHLSPVVEEEKQVVLQRNGAVHLDPSFFAFFEKKSPEYKEFILDRAAQIASTLTETSAPAQALQALEKGDLSGLETILLHLRTSEELINTNPFLGNRYAALLTQGHFADRKASLEALSGAFDRLRDLIKGEKQKDLSAENKAALETKETDILKAKTILKRHESLFSKGKEPLPLNTLRASLKQSGHVSFDKTNAVFASLSIDWEKESIHLTPYTDLSDFGKEGALEKLSQPVIDEIAKIKSRCHETTEWAKHGIDIPYAESEETTGCIALNLHKIADAQVEHLIQSIRQKWHPQHPDLQTCPIVSYEAYTSLPWDQKAVCLVLTSPSSALSGLKTDSLYCALHGITPIAKSYEGISDSPLSQVLYRDLGILQDILRSEGFFNAFVQESLPFSVDAVFEKPNFAAPILEASREHFVVHGAGNYATLELSTREKRILTENKIDTAIHEDLIRWQDDYLASQVNLNPKVRFDVPKPTRNVFISNLLLSLKKLYRGDERKILRWGLDLSGGKTVEIELRDANHQVVDREADVKQGLGELYRRINKMGVSEVSLRQVGHHIVLDFPGSQALSASELIQASTMFFHVVNEKFSPQNPEIGNHVERFLTDVWNEALVTGKQEISSIQEIARHHLYGENQDLKNPRPKSESARILLENGLKLPLEGQKEASPLFDETFSKIAMFRGTKPADWQGRPHPLILVFHNYALEGSQLSQIHSSYDPSKGNYLSFEVLRSLRTSQDDWIYPQKNLHAWTSHFAKENIRGTPYEAYSHGHGWRMAVVLNDSIISAPSLESALQESAMISGSFSQREAEKLASDLKAGSLTFSPHILSEKNISPELGQADRFQGIMATLVALLLVVISMVAYYRFAGVVASVAVFFNLLILWAVLQNLGATLTLAGIAGIILTVGMSIDANVLVFERIKEEMALSGRLAYAIASGYKKAFGAIIDSNITTIIAAMILLNYDAGPIKSFAVNLIIGIASSMFTALFMTRIYFNRWVQNPKHKTLRMAHWIRPTHFDFLKKARVSFLISLAIIVGGFSCLFLKSSTIVGLDFSGGFALNLEISPKNASFDYAQAVEKIFAQEGISSQDIQVRSLTPSHHVRLLLSPSMEEKGKPFYQMPLEQDGVEGSLLYKKNPRINWIANALEKANLPLEQSSLADLHSHWTSISSQMSDSMRNNALFGFLLSFVAIFIYLAFRFEYKFAAAALLCLIHDVLITLAVMGLLHFFHVPIQLDLITMAALMTAVGYSLNDTIIIFDRIREEMQESPQKSLPSLVNHALNFTLSRTVITSGTTLLVLLALLILGGSSIFGFALVMTIGVIFGTISSWLIASPLMLFFHKREESSLSVPS